MFPSSTKVLTGLAAAIVISAGVVWHRYFRRVAQSDTDLNRHPGVTSSYIVKPGLQPRPTDAPPSIGKVWLIVHHGRSPAGYTTGFLQKQGRDVEIIDFELPTSTFPPVDDRYEGIVFLGGYQGAYESDIHPFLTKEKEFMIAHHKRGTPMLGICLGCQLLADALGGKVCEQRTFSFTPHLIIPSFLSSHKRKCLDLPYISSYLSFSIVLWPPNCVILFGPCVSHPVL